MNKIRVSVIGAAGYTGGELIRILLQHPLVEIVDLVSQSQSGLCISDVHSDLLGDSDLLFSSELNTDCDVIFLCSAHGDSRKWLENNKIPDHVKIIDLSRDFRLKNESQIGGRNFIYGLSEWNSSKISSAINIANPGCFATCIQLAILPFAAENKIGSDVHITAVTGSTGAGVSPTSTTHFSWRNNNLNCYQPFSHPHMDEIKETVHEIGNDFNSEIHFLPVRGNFSRGIYSMMYFKSSLTEDEAFSVFQKYYGDSAFVHYSKEMPDVKQVVNSNKCLIHIQKKEDQLLVISAIDNLLKGASGQAVQNMNIMFGIPENSGLKIKTSAF